MTNLSNYGIIWRNFLPRIIGRKGKIMKEWFNSLEEDMRKKVVIGAWLITVASFLLFLLLPSEAGIATFVSLIFTVALVFSIIFTKWNSKAKKVSASPTSSWYEDSPKEIERKKRREEYLRNKVITAQKELDALPRYTIEISNEPRKRRTGYEEVSYSNITPKGKYPEFVVFDTETTGLSGSRDRIVELSAIRFVGGVPIEIFETFINPEREISPEASAINHITNDMVANAPTISEVLPSFEAFVGESPLVAHNLEFDIKFLFYSGSIITDTPRKYYDTLAQSQKMLKKMKRKYNREYDMWEEDYDSDWDVIDYKLDTVAEYFDITFPCQHRASGDAMVAGKVFLKLIEKKQKEV